jgi:hypothetical protein
MFYIPKAKDLSSSYYDMWLTLIFNLAGSYLYRISIEMGSPTQLKTTVITLYVLSCFMVLVRCIVRTTIVKSFKYDDWLMVITLVCP